MKTEEIKKELEKILKESADKTVLIGIDGMCASGKTTLCAEIEKNYDCNVFHMDDFFLRPEQRTPERLREVGGNVDYERFKEEVLIPLSEGQAFSYRPFSCRTMELADKIHIFPKKINIIEGAYCLHPYFGTPYDYRFFMDISEEEQKKRILERNGEKMYQRFLTEWIPKENAYFAEFQINSTFRRGIL